MIMGSPKRFWDQSKDLFAGFVGILLSKVVETLFWVFTRIFMRYHSHEAIDTACSSNFCHESYETDSNNSETKPEAVAGSSQSSEDSELKSERFGEVTDTIEAEYSQIDSNGCEPESESKEECSEAVSVNYVGNLGLEEEETTKLVFKFQYQTWNLSEEFKEGYSESSDSVNTDEYEFTSSCAQSKDCPLENYSDFLSERNFKPENCETCVDAAEKLKAVPSGEDQEEKLKNNVSMKESSAADNFLSEDDLICLSFGLDSLSSIGDGCLSDKDFGITPELDTIGDHDEGLVLGEEKHSKKFDDEDRDIMEELRKFEDDSGVLKNSGIENMEKLTGHCFQDRHSINSKPEESAKPGSHSSIGLNIEDSNRFDTLWEHQDLIEQLKVELNKFRATGLPTILENSESPRIMEDLKPWEIDEKFQHGSAVNELPKFYRSYREGMRKFDILNYQKLYAIGFLQSRDQLQSFSSRENSSPTIKSLLAQSFRPSRHRKSESEPTKKFMRELYSDLEMVYVGQLCLSCEILQWQYQKALEFLESDQFVLQRYNEVAGELQQFQVLLQRFMENERFQGPRVENYVRSRGSIRNLLQVPVIREDRANDKKKFGEREEGKDAITIDMLVEILEESIRTIWHFIRADKDASSWIHKGPREPQVELADLSDSELVLEVRAELQKKEKRLGEFMKSRNSILKKFQKHEEDVMDHFLYFFSHVDMKLVWRVLNMSRISKDQLAWCRNKLNKINFVNRRIHVEPSFLLFPC